jgi:hypothetical protein
VRRGRRGWFRPARRGNDAVVRKIAVLGGLVALAAVARRALRRPAEWHAPSLGPPAPPPEAAGDAGPVVAVSAEPAPPPPEPKPPSEADQTDREIESRLDDETKYDRFREQEESARREAAERLRNDPLVTPADADAST